ncbi:MAG: hypothetical protein LBO63_01610 [Oscillospiraceae bacterium]|jgi:hypothetical protein|nr:hypothetical protein [Oscillospiraceae bacterium]
MQEKYEKLFYEFVPQETNWGDWCHSPQAYFRGEKDIPGAVMNVGFQVFKKPQLLEREPHFHREDEYLVFLGATLPDTFSGWDAEVHFFLGKTLDTMEKIVITEPTIIKLPKGYWHSPLNFVRIDKPLMFQAVVLAGKEGCIKFVENKKTGDRQYIFSGDETRLCVFDSHKSCNYCGYCFSHPEKLPESPYTYVPWTVVNEDGVESYTDTGAYDPSKAPASPDCVITPDYKSKPYSDATKLKAPKPALSSDIAKCVLAFPKEETQWGDWCPSPQVYFRGETYMEDATYHVGYQVFAGPNDMEDTHFHQGVEEYIFFMGADPMNIFDFDAEIEMFFGDDPDHLESKIITKPTVVRIPANVWHCPIKFRKMNKPLVFQAAFLSGTWGTITQAPADKEPVIPQEVLDKMPFARAHTYNYIGDNVRFCKFNDKKRCNICGACFPKPDEYLKD